MVSENNLLINYGESLIEVTIDDVNRVLELGRLLLSVLTEEEIGELRRIGTPKAFLENLENR